MAKAVLIGAIPPLMLKTSANPGGLPIEVFDQLRAGVTADRSQFWKDLSMPFYGYNRPGAKISEGVREPFWLQGMMAGFPASYFCIKAFSETDTTEDLKKFDVPTLILHGDDDQIVPIGASAMLSSKIVKNATLKDLQGRAARHVHDAQGPGQRRSAVVPEVTSFSHDRQASTRSDAGTAEKEDIMAMARQHSQSRRSFCLCCIGSATFAATGGWLTPSQVFAEARELVDLIRSEAAKAPIKVHKLRGNVSVLEGSGGFRRPRWLQAGAGHCHASAPRGRDPSGHHGGDGLAAALGPRVLLRSGAQQART